MNIAIYFFIKLTLFRYFTSIPLLQTLESYGIYGCGTIMVNRKGFPAQLKNPHLANRGDAEQMRHNNLVATVWNDAKPVCLHSLILTFHFIEHLQFSYTVKLYIVFIFLIIRFVHLFFEGSHCIHNCTSDPLGDGPAQRRIRGGDVIIIPRPPAVEHYQQNYYGVDRT